VIEEAALQRASYDSLRHFPANTKSIIAPHSSIAVQ
jgi:hypothetical protein